MHKEPINWGVVRWNQSVGPPIVDGKNMKKSWIRIFRGKDLVFFHLVETLLIFSLYLSAYLGIT
jgi:hypothetical protein